MTIPGFRNSSFQSRQYKRVQLIIYSQYDHRELAMEALEVPEISKDLTRLTEKTIVHECDANAMPFPDFFCLENQPKQSISLLIGADFYWKLATGDIQHLNEHLTTGKTAFGWTVHGGTAFFSRMIGSRE